MGALHLKGDSDGESCLGVKWGEVFPRPGASVIAALQLLRAFTGCAASVLLPLPQRVSDDVDITLNCTMRDLALGLVVPYNWTREVRARLWERGWCGTSVLGHVPGAREMHDRPSPTPPILSAMAWCVVGFCGRHHALCVEAMGL